MGRKLNIPLRNCEICGIVIQRINGKKRINIPQYKKARVCSRKCWGKLFSKEYIGENNPNYRGGKSQCIKCGEELAYRYSYRNTIYCKKCWHEYHKGENHCRWKGEDIIRLYDKIRNCLKYREWRDFVYQRDKYTCQKCSDNKGGNLVAHHIKSFSEVMKNIKTYQEAENNYELWNVHNGITLCKKCHISIHKKL